MNRKTLIALIAALCLAWSACAGAAGWNDAEAIRCGENRSSCLLLQMAVRGSFADYNPDDTLSGRVLSAVYPQLCAVQEDDFKHCAEENDLDETELYHCYNAAMANCLWADIRTEGLPEEQMSAPRRVLLLFLNPGSEVDAEAQMAAIREGMTDETLTRIADGVGASEDFVRWLIETDDWQADAAPEAGDAESAGKEEQTGE